MRTQACSYVSQSEKAKHISDKQQTGYTLCSEHYVQGPGLQSYDSNINNNIFIQKEKFMSLIVGFFSTPVAPEVPFSPA